MTLTAGKPGEALKMNHPNTEKSMTGRKAAQEIPSFSVTSGRSASRLDPC
jgi:hypothetical protein